MIIKMESASGHTVLHLSNSKISTEKTVTSVYIANIPQFEIAC